MVTTLKNKKFIISAALASAIFSAAAFAAFFHGETKTAAAELYPQATAVNEISNSADQDKYLYSRIGLEKDGVNVLDMTRGSTEKHRSVIVVIDTGVNYNHEEFLDEEGNTRISDRSYSVGEGVTVKEGGWNILRDSSLQDYHGTQVCGSIFASGKNDKGFYGLAEDAELIFIKVPLTEQGGYTSASIQAALDYAISVKPDVVNLSMGAYNTSNYYGTRIKKLKEQGTVVVTAAGNESRSDAHYPSADNNVIGVGAFANLKSYAIGASDYPLASYSSFGDKNVDICAPGTFWQTYTDVTGASLYKESNGTSVAAPVVTAAVALYKSLYPEATPDEVIRDLYSSAKDCGDYGKDYEFGYGGIDFYNFLFGEKGAVTFDFSDGNTVSMPVTQGVPLQEYPFPTEIPAGKYFGGWYADKACTKPLTYYTQTLEAGATVYAKWTEEETQGAFDYTLTRKNEGVIKGYYGSDKRIIAPDCIEYGDKTYSVSKLAARAFQSRNAEKIILPFGVKDVGEYAFADNPLSFVYFPDTVEKVRLYAFSGVKNATLYLQGEDRTTDSKVFYVKSYSSTNTTVTWESGSTLTVAAEAGDYLYVDGKELIGHEGDYCLLCYDGEKSDVDFSGLFITEVGQNAFRGSLVQKVFLPNVQKLGTGAFEGCSALSSVQIPVVEEIGARAFYGCSALSVLKFPKSLHLMGESAFENCTRLCEADFSQCETLRSIGDSAFKNCGALQFVDLQSVTSLAEVGDYAFYGCSELFFAALPQDLQDLGYGAFTLCDRLHSLKIPFVGKTAKSANVYYNFGYIFGASQTSIQGDALPASLTYVYIYTPNAVNAAALKNLKGITFFFVGDAPSSADCTVYAQGDFSLVEIYCENLLCGIYGGCVGMEVNGDELASSYLVPSAFASAGLDCNGDGICDSLPERISTKGVQRWELAERQEKSFTISFYDYDGSLLSEKTYDYGAEVIAPVPVRASNEQYEYPFIGWDQPLTLAVADAEYTACYQEQLRCYTVRFLTPEGEVISERVVEYGAVPLCPNVQDRTIDQVFFNKFTGWNSIVVAVTRDAEYTAVFTKTYVEYKISFVYADSGVVFSEVYYHYGDTVTLPSVERPADERYAYTFVKWTSPFSAVTQDAVYEAEYEKAYVEYTVSFKDYDGQVLATNSYHYGETPVPPTDPVRVDDGEYQYIFAGWEPQLSPVVGNTEYVAVYTAASLKVTVRFISEGIVLSFMQYDKGETIVLPAEPKKEAAGNGYYYVFKGWTPTVVEFAESDVDYTAVFERKVYVHTIKFVGQDGETISEAEYQHGALISIPEAPIRSAEKEENVCSYSFLGWSPEVSSRAVGDATYSARFEAKEHRYSDVVTAPTCTESGYTTHTCETCGYSYVDSKTNAMGHTTGEWIIDEEAKVGEAGLRHKECTECGRIIEEEEIPAIPAESNEESSKEQSEGCLSSIGALGSFAWLLMGGAVLSILHNKKKRFEMVSTCQGDKREL